MNKLTKRRFFALSGQAALGLAALPSAAPQARAVEPFQRPGPSRIRASLCAYSFRADFKDQDSGQPKPGASLDMFQFVEYCAREGWDGAELTSYYFPKNFATAYLARLKRHLGLAGVSVSGSSVSCNLTRPAGEARDRDIAHVKEWLAYSSFLGAPYMRVFAGSTKDQSVEESRKWALDGLVECAAAAEKHGVMLGLEDHGGIVGSADGVLSLIQPAKTDWLGVNLDVGNFETADPYEDIRRCAPYAVNVHWKPRMKARGASVAQDADWPRIVKILRDANYHGYLALEYESKEDPHTAVPKLLLRTRAVLAG